MIAIFFFLCCVYLVIGPIIDEPKIEFLYAGIFVISGLILYFPFVHFKLKIPGTGEYYMSHLMRKPTICLGKNTGADQLRGYREADQHLCFRNSDSTIPLLLYYKISSL